MNSSPNISNLKYLFAPKKVFVVILAPFLYWIIYGGHFLLQDKSLFPTGFLLGDFPYYSASGREVFENGNGFAYPNPYDPGSPVLYFHWYYTLLGLGIKFFNIDPGHNFLAWGLIGAIATSFLTFEILKNILPKKNFIISLFLLTMWGGGVFFIATSLLQIMGWFDSNQSPFFFDPFGGDWALNWGRNMLYPQEAIYHALSAMTFLALLKRKWPIAIIGAAALASTTPFTGVQIVLIVLASFVFLFFYEKKRGYLIYGTITVAILALLLGYYYIFLKSFDAYNSIHHRFILSDWILPWPSFFLAYTPLGILATYRIIKEHKIFTYKEWLMVVWLVISLALVKNELFLPTPIQPLHFTRGYVWFPLMLLALPLFQKWLTHLYETKTRLFSRLVFTTFFLIFVLDNLAFVKWRTFDIDTFMYLTIPQREIFSWIDQNNLEGTLLSSNYDLSYLSATYTNVTPYVGYWNLTPEFDTRLMQVLKCSEHTQSEKWVEKIDYVLIENDFFPECLKNLTWFKIHTINDISLYEKVRP